MFSRHEKFTIIEAKPESGQALLRAMQEHQPEIVVMDDTLQMEYLNYLLYYMRSSEDLRIVVVNTNSNRVEVYHKQQVPVKQSADFFAVF